MRETWGRATPALAIDPPAATRAVATLPGSPAVLRVTPLAGGLANTCLRLDFADGRAPAVLRIHQRDPGAAPREAALHRHALSLGLPVPAVLLEIPASIGLGGPALLLDHVAGTRGDVVLAAMDDAGAAAVGQQLGGLLARLHAVHPGPVGLLGPDLRVATPFSDADAGLAGFIDRCITHGRGAARLGPVLADRLCAMIATEARRQQPPDHPPSLVHGDMDPTNLLIGDDGRITAILDWEFALSASPYVDLGHLLRPPLGDRPGFAAALAQGYRQAGGRLPEDWSIKARLVDLTAWAEFLDRPSISDGLHRSARQHIARTITIIAGATP
ncbi:hypothetical protein GCM10011505_40400 [Tistrella bauzanensis]|uniref:Aminoglycoside phosphotransferase domain-containing protein n=1 Tax=Tistrella bauzanensis TaxID=657419 RepID=A0ABQ1IY11_9PROT|nr:phosphotransferase [Tistrella bauzanensis]GGB55343.1 hypothetical protein GCM10011505_40400 [Tistrella bauzanensis]